MCVCVCVQVVLYAGDSSSGAKVAEYGGNTHGFGSRSVLGKGWPKDLVKVGSPSMEWGVACSTWCVGLVCLRRRFSLTQ